ncbi:DUF6035 family protein [Brevundimonas sp.]|uniref:DUF6035 family protein n=1 Tax=Brevundimonas sp. TaxID=1871086 RepID=UPI001809F556|nr:DUF6035 family protein [Brevundimonas sp.]MBA4806905.1 hypothetical protein [Brevundimonas sp.]
MVATVRKPQRTLERATDLSTGATLSSDDLLAIDPDRYQRIRRNAAAARREGGAAYVCEMCGHAVYAPKEARTLLPYWRHHKGAPTTCPWWTGDPATVDQRSAAQFQGAQESPLHSWLKHQVGAVLALDPATETGSIHIDEYLKGETGSRRPDVRAVNGSRKLAFEIQLSSTQLPIIDSREHFYGREGYHLIWLTWKFQAVPRRLMLTAFLDIFYSHNKNLFSLDEEVLARAREEGRFLVRCHWEEGREWRSTILPLADLTWPASGLPYGVSPWRVDFLRRWCEAVEDGRLPWQARQDLLAELIEHLALPDMAPRDLDDLQIPVLISMILSLELGRPVASKQSNLVEMLNTFFSNSAERHKFAGLIRRVAGATNQGVALEKQSVARKLRASLTSPQITQGSVEGRIVHRLFPEILLRPSA